MLNKYQAITSLCYLLLYACLSVYKVIGIVEPDHTFQPRTVK